MTIYQKIKKGLSVVAQVIITAPVKLPAKLLQGAQYLALLIGLLDSMEEEGKQQEATKEEAGES